MSINVRREVRADGIQAPAVKKAPAKKQPLASKKNAPNESISEEDSDFVKSPVKPKGKSKDTVLDSDDENIPVGNGSTKQKSASEMYQKVCILNLKLRLKT